MYYCLHAVNGWTEMLTSDYEIAYGIPNVMISLTMAWSFLQKSAH
jgi:hypothetical protein